MVVTGEDGSELIGGEVARRRAGKEAAACEPAGWEGGGVVGGNRREMPW